MCYPYLEERAEDMLEVINYDIDDPLSDAEADEYYTMIQKMYYIPGLESWASEKVRKFYKDREKLYLSKNSPEFQKAKGILDAKCALLDCSSGYEPYVVEPDGQIVYYGRFRRWFNDLSEHLKLFLFRGGDHCIKNSAYCNTKITNVHICGGGKLQIGSFVFSGCEMLREVYIANNIEIGKVEMPFSCFNDCHKSLKLNVPQKLKEILNQDPL